VALLSNHGAQRNMSVSVCPSVAHDSTCPLSTDVMDKKAVEQAGIEEGGT